LAERFREGGNGWGLRLGPTAETKTKVKKKKIRPTGKGADAGGEDNKINCRWRGTLAVLGVKWSWGGMRGQEKIEKVNKTQQELDVRKKKDSANRGGVGENKSVRREKSKAGESAGQRRRERKECGENRISKSDEKGILGKEGVVVWVVPEKKGEKTGAPARVDCARKSRGKGKKSEGKDVSPKPKKEPGKREEGGGRRGPKTRPNGWGGSPRGGGGKSRNVITLTGNARKKKKPETAEKTHQTHTVGTSIFQTSQPGARVDISHSTSRWNRNRVSGKGKAPCEMIKGDQIAKNTLKTTAMWSWDLKKKNGACPVLFIKRKGKQKKRGGTVKGTHNAGGKKK